MDSVNTRTGRLSVVRVLGLGVLCGVAILLGGPGWAAQTNRPPSTVPAPKSTFVTNDPSGVDPFFPNSVRRKAQQSSNDQSKTPRPVGVGALQLKGIMGPPDKRIALINNLTFAKGEEGEVRVPDGKLKIRCVDIRTKSVVVTLEGQSEEHELVLPERVLPTPE